MSLPLLSHHLGVDLGSSSVCIYDADLGTLLHEPSLVAEWQEGGRDMQAFGEDAAQVASHLSGNGVLIQPILGGAVSDPNRAALLLRHLLRKVIGRSVLTWPRMVLCMPDNATEAERRALLAVARSAGANKAYLLQEILATGVGAGLPIGDMAGVMVANIGGGTTEAAVLAYNGIVAARTVRTGGQRLDEALVQYIKREHNITIDRALAEEVRFALGSALPPEREETVHVDGWDIFSGAKKIFEISATEVYLAMKETITIIVSTIRQTLAQTPPEIASDIMAGGICLAGGCAVLRGLQPLLQAETGIPVYVAESPADCAAIGAGRMAGNMEFLRKAVHYGSSEE